MCDTYFRKLLVFGAVSCFVFLSSCSSVRMTSQQVMPHMIALKGDGNPYSLRPKEVPASKYDYDAHLDAIVNGLQSNKSGKVLIFVHGGMVPIKTSIAEAETQTSRKYWKENKVYPIYINWESGMGKAYWDHLWKIRQGSEQPVLAPLTAPLYLGADLGRAVTRLPITYAWQVPNLLGVQDPYPKEPQHRRGQLARIPKENIIIPRGKENLQIPISEHANRLRTNVVPGALRIVTTPILDMVGKSSWDNMLRRTQTIFRSPLKADTDSLKDGGLSKLMDRIRAENICRVRAGKNRLRVTLIGHSMGSIVANEIVRRYGDLNFENIVYLAAACSIKDFHDTVIPYMGKNGNTKFYSVGLHPYADRRETTAFGLLPQGSLLDWIDDFASNPQTRMDHTMGKWNNVMRVLSVIEKGVSQNVLKRIHLNAFPYLPKENGRYPYPRKHGSFNDLDNVDSNGRGIQFWMKDYWTWRRP